MAEIPYVCLYRSYYEELENFSSEERGRLLWALLEYLYTGQEPDLPEPERYFWPRLRSQHQRDAAHYEETCERNRSNGIKGGKASGKARVSKGVNAEHFEAVASNGEHGAHIEAVASNGEHGAHVEAVAPKEKEKEREKEKEKECVLRTEKHTPFSKPNITQVSLYCAEQGLTLVDAERFVTYYDTVGWTCGGKPMKDWKAAVRLWNQSERNKMEGQHGLDGTEPTGKYGTVV